MEVGEAVFALDFVDAELDFAECMVFVCLQVCKRDFENAALECVIGVFQTSCAIDESFADTGMVSLAGKGRSR